MKIAAILLYIVTLAGCATTTELVTVPKVQPSADIMLDCKPFAKPKSGSYDELKVLMVENKGIYDSCSKQNKFKKEFIINNYR